jgi:hypothetical protein
MVRTAAGSSPVNNCQAIVISQMLACVWVWASCSKTQQTLGGGTAAWNIEA